MTEITALENGKLDAVKEFGKEHGWTHGSIKRHPSDDAVTLNMRREKAEGGEFVSVRWDGNAVKELIVVSDGTKLKYVRNVAALKRHLSATAEERAALFVEKPKAEKKSRSDSPKREKGAPASKRERKHRINFKLDADDEDILEALRGHKIVWKSRVSGDYDEDVISADRNRHADKFKIEDFDDNRQVHFVGAYGFRAVYLNQIVSVR